VHAGPACPRCGHLTADREVLALLLVGWPAAANAVAARSRASTARTGGGGGGARGTRSVGDRGVLLVPVACISRLPVKAT
jgi:hypothetical protein